MWRYYEIMKLSQFSFIVIRVLIVVLIKPESVVRAAQSTPWTAFWHCYFLVQRSPSFFVWSTLYIVVGRLCDVQSALVWFFILFTLGVKFKLNLCSCIFCGISQSPEFSYFSPLLLLVQNHQSWKCKVMWFYTIRQKV